MFFCMNRFIPVSAPLELPLAFVETHQFLDAARTDPLSGKWGPLQVGGRRTAAIPVQSKSARKKSPGYGAVLRGIGGEPSLRTIHE
jgi:hypothetical protein